jgi:glycosyltransferase involved in cell wall biosynthesis
MYQYSIIIPVNRRPHEISELLQSICTQEYKNFEVIIVDNSPDESMKNSILSYRRMLKLNYLFHRGMGVSESRNTGVNYATGDYVVFIDSDCILPPGYLNKVDEYLSANGCDAFGGPDRAHDSFTAKQKAISYAMTSFFTTGGIRGRKSHIGRYYPRSFNMGVRRELFNRLKGFRSLKVSEDIDLSIRIYNEGKSVSLIEEAYVYHKRRATFGKFFRQVFYFGYGRFSLGKMHGDAVRPVHMLPSAFVVFLVLGLPAVMFSAVLAKLWLTALLVYAALVFMDSLVKNRSAIVGLLSIIATFIMLTGYGSGMLKAALSEKRQPDRDAGKQMQ